MITSLADLIKISFKNNGKFIKIEDELYQVKQYIYLQSIKYDNLFETKWEIDKSILNKLTTKLILQPLVENAIIHGIVPARRFCTLTIQAFQENSNIIFKIIDDGVGIATENLKFLQGTLINSNYIVSSGIGLCNVNQRIKIIYGCDEYGCMIDSNGITTTVTVTIPDISM